MEIDVIPIYLEYQKIQAEIDRREAKEAARTRIGFLAQDVQKVLPELVQTDDKGVMSIDYAGFIPLIVESIKEMQATIEAQSKQIETLLSATGGINADFRSAVSTEEANTLGEGKLYDAPGASVIYALPADYSTADLLVYDITGKLLKKIKLDNSINRIDLNSSETGYGTFIYALVVDGRKHDTLKKYISR
ncbi:MAG: tail fiber domain-containing protein [Tannerellaceae bacterium]|nr:tail fiber domain-containing protein [Tannerellaceae bacterium]